MKSQLKEWYCKKGESDAKQVSNGSKCFIKCNNGYRISNLTKFKFFQYLIHTLDRKKYSRRCKKGGIWSQSKAKVKCEKDGKINKFDGTLFVIKDEFDDLMKIINQLTETNQFLQNNIAKKNATIIALEEAMNDCSNATISTTEVPEPPMIIVVPSSAEINRHRSKVAKITRNPFYFTFRRN